MVEVLPQQEVPEAAPAQSSMPVQQPITQQPPPPAAAVSGPSRQAVMPQPIYRNNGGIVESLFNKLKTAAGFSDPFSAYYPGAAFAPPYLSQGNLQFTPEEMIRQQQMMAIAPPPPNPSMAMAPMNYLQQQQQQEQQLLILGNPSMNYPMMMNGYSQQQPYYPQQPYYQPQPSYYPQPQPYYQHPQSYYPQQMPPYDDFARNYPYDARYGLYPQRSNRFSSVKDLRPY
ncbi:hypothetical protein CU098_012168, partial [Rhizopus stolonifer]